MLLDNTEVIAFYKKVEKEFIKWAKMQDHIRAAIVVGSRARTKHPADQWSDLDIIIYSTQPNILINSEEWVTNFGTPIITIIEQTVRDGWERRVLYDNGLDVDFAVDPFDYLLQIKEQGVTPELVAQLSNIIGRGIRVLVDKEKLFDDFLKQFSIIPVPPQSPPTEHEFVERVNDFWYHTIWTAKRIRRGELWEAKGGLDSYMKWRCILPMIEWHTQVTQRQDQDTWFRGRFLEHWAAPRIVTGLRDAFARYDEDDMWHALAASMNLFRWIAKEVAEILGYSYPKEADHFTSLWVDAAYWNRGSNE